MIWPTRFDFAVSPDVAWEEVKAALAPIGGVVASEDFRTILIERRSPIDAVELKLVVRPGVTDEASVLMVEEASVDVVDEPLLAGADVESGQGLESLFIELVYVINGLHSLRDPLVYALQHEEFRLALKGYDVREVDEFLEALLVRLQGGESLFPEDLVSNEFRVSWKGYNKQGVDDFLERLAAATPAVWGTRGALAVSGMDEQVPTWRAKTAVDHLAGRRLASWRRRAAGFVIDAVLMGVVPLACFGAFGASLPPAQGANNTQPLSASSALWLVTALVLSLGIVVAYPVWFIGRRGQTPGMRRVRIRLSRIDAEDNLSDVDFATSWRRWLYALPFWVTALYGVTLLADYLWPLRDHRHQCLHDRWAKTVALEDLM